MSPPDPHDFEAMYAHNDAPWDIGRPQQAFKDATAKGLLTGKVLDVGCGTGEHSLLAAAAGLEVTGVDLSSTAIGRARSKARHRSINAQFLTADLTADPPPNLGGQFDTIIDCGTFHVFTNAMRVPFQQFLTAHTKVGSRYFMLCFSDKAPGTSGPRRLSQESIRAGFAPNWELTAIEESIIETTIPNVTIPAWFAVLTRQA